MRLLATVLAAMLIAVLAWFAGRSYSRPAAQATATPTPLAPSTPTPAAPLPTPSPLRHRLAGTVVGDVRYAVIEDAAGGNDLYRPGQTVPDLGLLPLTILLGFVAAAWLLPDLSGFEMALLATMLAPTDAALGKAVISNKLVPAEIRESLNIESGLNDGICAPILFLFLALAVDAGASDRGAELALELVIHEIGIGLLVGVAAHACYQLVIAPHCQAGLD